MTPPASAVPRHWLPCAADHEHLFACHGNGVSRRHNMGVAPRALTQAVSTARSLRESSRRALGWTGRTGKRWGLRVVGAAVAFAFALTMVVYPVRDYFEQRDRIRARETEFEALADANEQLFNEVQRLRTPEGVRSAARSQLGYVLPGEDRIALTPMPALPTALPQSWPYSMVTDILRVRTAQASTSNGALAPLAPPSQP